jgi:hypothetical protein
MSLPPLRVVVDGDSNKIYRRGDKVTGRVLLLADEQQDIESLKVVFTGACVTKTTRPSHPGTLNANGLNTKREFEERICLFNVEKNIVPQSALTTNKYSWTFEFVFPETTQPRYKRLTRGSHYMKDPHPLPPTFQLKSSVPGGTAQISYSVQARIVFAGSRGMQKAKQSIQYVPTPRVNLPREANFTTTVLYGQTWKPAKGAPRMSVEKTLRRSSKDRTPRVVPNIHYPETIAPGQHIPIALSLLNTRDRLNESKQECIIDSLSITISTYSTTMCGHSMKEPEDVVSKHITCIAKTNMNKSIPFGKTRSLTSNFRLVDDTECVPTFKSYSVTRRYTLGVSVGLKYADQHFTVRSNTPLEIVARTPRSALPASLDHHDDVDPLPPYVPREPSREFAPDYETIYALARSSSTTSGSLASLRSRGSSVASIISTPATAPSTPVSETRHIVFTPLLGLPV